MKKCVSVVLSVCLVLCITQGAAMAAALYDAVWVPTAPQGSFFYSVNWANSYDDWAKVGSAGYENYFNLSPATNLSLKISTNAPSGTVAISAGTWAGFQWSVPASATQIAYNTPVDTAGWKIDKFQVNGWNTFDVSSTGVKVYLVDGSWNGASDPAVSGHVLWEQTVQGWLPNTLDTLTHASSNLRFIVYVPQDIILFDTNYVEAGTSSMILGTVVPEPATLMLLGLGGMLLRRKNA